MASVCVGSPTYQRGARAWAVEESDYATEEPSPLLRYDFVFFLQYTIFTPFRASFAMYIHTVYSVSRPRLRTKLWFVVGSAIV
jgi:hypothetical protein